MIGWRLKLNARGGNNFTGAEVRASTLGQIALSHWLSPARQHDVAPHDHLHPHFVLVTGGRYLADAAAREGTTSPLMFNPPQTTHADHVGEGGGSFLTVTYFADPSELTETRLPRAPVILDPAFAGLGFQLMNAWSSGEALSAEAASLEMLAALASAPPPRSTQRWLSRCASMLADIECPDLRIADLAREFSVHPVYLSRAFRSAYRCTPGEYRTAHRLRRAATLLGKSNAPLSELAVTVGFVDQSHFTNSFSRRYGVSPAKFRRIVQS